MAEQNAGQKPGQKKDELANLLGAMADGDHPDDTEQAEDESAPSAPVPQPETALVPVVAAASMPPRIVRPQSPDSPSAGLPRPAIPTSSSTESTPTWPSMPSPQPVRADARPASRAIHPSPPQHMVQRLIFKRTIIPICLNLGTISVLLPVVGFFSSATSPLSRFGGWVGAGFFLLGMVMYGVAILTMMQVKHGQARQVDPPVPRPR